LGPGPTSLNLDPGPEILQNAIFDNVRRLSGARRDFRESEAAASLHLLNSGIYNNLL
jgi:hypothetical protein